MVVADLVIPNFHLVIILQKERGKSLVVLNVKLNNIIES